MKAVWIGIGVVVLFLASEGDCGWRRGHHSGWSRGRRYWHGGRRSRRLRMNSIQNMDCSNLEVNETTSLRNAMVCQQMLVSLVEVMTGRAIGGPEDFLDQSFHPNTDGKRVVRAKRQVVEDRAFERAKSKICCFLGRSKRAKETCCVELKTFCAEPEEQSGGKALPMKVMTSETAPDSSEEMENDAVVIDLQDAFRELLESLLN